MDELELFEVADVAIRLQEAIREVEALEALCKEISLDTQILQEHLTETDVVSWLRVVQILFQDAIEREWEMNRLVWTCTLEFYKSLEQLCTASSLLNQDFGKLRKKYMVNWRYSECTQRRSEQLYKLINLCKQRGDLVLKIVAIPSTMYNSERVPSVAGLECSPASSRDDVPIESTYIREHRRLQQLAAQSDAAHRAKSLDTMANFA